MNSNILIKYCKFLKKYLLAITLKTPSAPPLLKISKNPTKINNPTGLKIKYPKDTRLPESHEIDAHNIWNTLPAYIRKVYREHPIENLRPTVVYHKQFDDPNIERLYKTLTNGSTENFKNSQALGKHVITEYDPKIHGISPVPTLFIPLSKNQDRYTHKVAFSHELGHNIHRTIKQLAKYHNKEDELENLENNLKKAAEEEGFYYDGKEIIPNGRRNYGIYKTEDSKHNENIADLLAHSLIYGSNKKSLKDGIITLIKEIKQTHPKTASALAKFLGYGFLGTFIHAHKEAFPQQPLEN